MQSIQCLTCRHYLGLGECEAFGRGREIPAEIFGGLYDHREEFPGDGGLRWEPAEGVDPDILDDDQEEDE